MDLIFHKIIEKRPTRKHKPLSISFLMGFSKIWNTQTSKPRAKRLSSLKQSNNQVSPTGLKVITFKSASCNRIKGCYRFSKFTRLLLIRKPSKTLRFLRVFWNLFSFPVRNENNFMFGDLSFLFLHSFVCIPGISQPQLIFVLNFH